jgi:prepilin-type N-terminal cleavage/methylation domain-containing protein
MRNKKAFTLIEVMVVMAIIAVLAILIIGAIQLARKTATETTARSNAKGVQTALERVYATNKVYCGAGSAPTCTAVNGGVANMTAFLTAIGDPKMETVDCNAAAASGTVATVPGEIQNGVAVLNLQPQSYAIQAISADCDKVIDNYALE